MLKVISRVSFQKSSTVQIGGVKLSVVHEIGKEGVLALLGAGDFFGEGAWEVRLFGYGKWFRGTHACSRLRDTGFSAIRKSVPATNPISVYSQRPSATAHGSQEDTVWGAMPIPRLGNRRHWLDTQDGLHDVRPPGSLSTQLDPSV